jgi:hypothetical protein
MEYYITNRPYGQEVIFTSGGVNGSFLFAIGDNIEAKIAEYVALTSAPDAVQISSEKSSILTFVEQQKEELKWEIVDYLRSNPTGTFANFTSGMSWDLSSLSGVLVHRYAVNIRDMRGYPLPDESLESCWSLLSMVANALTMEQIREELQ